MSSLQSESARRTDDRLRYYIGEQYLDVLARDGLSEFSVNPGGGVFISVSGDGSMRHVGDMDPSRIEAFVRCVSSMLGASINPHGEFSVAGELPNDFPWRQARFQGAIPHGVGATFTLRMHSRGVIPLATYVERGILTAGRYRAVVDAIARRESFLIIAGTEGGKTTLLNALLDEYGRARPETRAVILEERRREIQSTLRNTLQLKSSDAMPMVRLAKEAMSQRPDLFIIGEVRGPEAALFIRAINSGHGGSMTTAHAGSVRVGLRLIETYSAQGDIPVTRQEIAQAVDWVIYMSKDDEHPAGREVKTLARINPELTERGDYQFEEVL